MKAILYKRFGPPEVLQLCEVDKPQPRDNELLIRIHATTVAAEDPGMRSSPGINGIFRPNRKILGWYLSGVVESTGGKVKKFKAGDAVFGSSGLSQGTYAEYKCLPEHAALALKPVNMNHQEAAAVPNGALTALPFLRDKGQITHGQKVLVNGASGAVGTAAVQLARYFGAEVTGVCSQANLDLVRSLGAAHVIDYGNEDFTQASVSYDIIFDAVGKSSFSACKKILAPNGVYLTTVPKLSIFLRQLLPKMKGKQAKFAATGLYKPDKKAADLNFMKEIIEAGHYKAVIDRLYPLEQIVEAHRYVEKGHKKGNVVITL